MYIPLLILLQVVVSSIPTYIHAQIMNMMSNTPWVATPRRKWMVSLSSPVLMMMVQVVKPLEKRKVEDVAREVVGLLNMNVDVYIDHLSFLQWREEEEEEEEEEHKEEEEEKEEAGRH